MLHQKRFTEASWFPRKTWISQEILCVVLPSSICVYHQKGNSIWLFMIWVFCNINMTKWLHSSQLQSHSPPLIFSLVQAILFFSTVSNPVESFWRHYRLHDMSCYIEVWNMFLNTYSYYYTIKNINVIKHTSLKKIHAYNILLLLILLFGITALYMLPKAKVNFFKMIYSQVVQMHGMLF